MNKDTIEIYYCNDCHTYFEEIGYKDINYNYGHDEVEEWWNTTEDIECCPCCKSTSGDIDTVWLTLSDVVELLNERED